VAQGAGERSEKPTADRLKKAREEGKIPQSQELPSALVILALLAACALAGPWVGRWFISELRVGMGSQMHMPLTIGSLDMIFREKVTASLLHAGPFMLAVILGSMGAGMLVGGWSFSPKAMAINWGALKPGAGMKQLFSSRSVVQMLAGALKVTFLLTIVYLYMRDRMGQIMALAWTSPEGLIVGIGGLLLGLVGRCGIGLLVIAGGDWLYQRFKYMRDLRMTKQEVIEERKQQEVSPQMRGRIRRMQFEMSRKRMLQDVVKADVVVTNPTHFAVALKYDPAKAAAPVVLAKGADYLALRIVELAREHHVHTVHDAPLAQALYKTVDVGEAIPAKLYRAVARLLLHVYKLRGQTPPGAHRS
jgi:flagellar biosynthesis protein FlhB